MSNLAILNVKEIFQFYIIKETNLKASFEASNQINRSFWSKTAKMLITEFMWMTLQTLVQHM